MPDLYVREKESGAGMKTGLVLEGGAMRGMYTAGVLDVMLEQQVQVDAVVGVSAGAVFGCNYKSRQIGRTIRYNKAYCRDPRYMSIRSLIKTGDLFGEEFCYHELPERLDPFDLETFESNPVEFYVAATDVHTGKPVYHKCTDGKEEDLQWMRASASMPVVSRVVSVGGYELLDGGISDSIPVNWFRSQGYEKSIVVLTRAEGYRKKESAPNPAISFALRKYPAMAQAMADRAVMYNRQLDEVERLQKAGEIFVLRPSSPITISRTERDPEKLQEVYDLGRKDAMSNLEAMKRFLQKSGL